MARRSFPPSKHFPPDSDNRFVQELDQPFHTKIGQLLIARANYDPPTNHLVMQALNLNLDKVFGTANDLVVPYDDASRFDEGVRIDAECPFGTDDRSQSVVIHTNFFAQPEIHQLIINRFRQIATIS